MSRAEHWEQVYQTKGPDQVSWFQAEARLSRRLIETLARVRRAPRAARLDADPVLRPDGT